MIGNILRMIGIIEIYEKIFRNTPRASKEVFKAALHEKPSTFWKLFWEESKEIQFWAMLKSSFFKHFY